MPPTNGRGVESSADIVEMRIELGKMPGWGLREGCMFGIYVNCDHTPKVHLVRHWILFVLFGALIVDNFCPAIRYQMHQSRIGLPNEASGIK